MWFAAIKNNEWLNEKLDYLDKQINSAYDKIQDLENMNRKLSVAYYKNIQGYTKAKGKHYILNNETSNFELSIIDDLLQKSFNFSVGMVRNFGCIEIYTTEKGKFYPIIEGCSVCLSEIIEKCEEYEKKGEKHESD